MYDSCSEIGKPTGTTQIMAKEPD
uniref:Uncharacterized protein n=1 Tax=Arundo donax TaxID=35708 RepID=A0A0A8YIN9_ARUDO